MPASTVLNKREEALLDNYRHIADEEDKGAVERMALMAARASQGETKMMVFMKESNNSYIGTF